MNPSLHIPWLTFGRYSGPKQADQGNNVAFPPTPVENRQTTEDSLLAEKSSEQVEDKPIPLKKPIPIYHAYNPAQETMVFTPPETIPILPQFSHQPEDNLLYMMILPLALDCFKSTDLLTFEEIWTHVIGKNCDVRGAKNIFANIIRLDNHHFNRWPLGRGTASLYYKKHSLSEVVIVPNDKITSIDAAFMKRNITPKVFSSLNQKKIPLKYELPVYQRDEGPFSYPEDIQQMNFLKSHLVKINTNTGSIDFAPFAIRWQAPDDDNEMKKKKRTREFYHRMQKRFETVILEYLVECHPPEDNSPATYLRIIRLIREKFPKLQIDETRKILERLVQKRPLMQKGGRHQYEGTTFKVGTEVTPEIIEKVQEILAQRRATAAGSKSVRNPTSIQRGSVPCTSQSQMDTRGNQTPEPIITSLHNLTENQFSIQINHPVGEGNWSAWSVMDSGKVENSQSSSAPMEDAMAGNQATVANLNPSGSSINTREITPGAGFLDDFPNNFEQNSTQGMNFAESSGNWQQVTVQERSQSFWADGQDACEEPVDQEIIVVDDEEEKKEPVFKVPIGRAPRKKRTITENEPETSKRPKEPEAENDDNFFGDI